MDSPAALCAWIVEKFWAWTDWDEHLDEVVGRDTLLDSVMLYWLPATGAASATPVLGEHPAGERVDLRAHEHDRGGHFPALEQPALFTAEVRAAFRPVR